MNQDLITHPIESGKAYIDKLDVITYPVLVSAKLDGIRCIKLDGKALTRKYLPIPNDFARNWVEEHIPDGFDGELLLRDWTTKFKEVSSAIMSKGGEPDFTYAAFDYVRDPSDPFSKRYADLDLEVGILTRDDVIAHRLFRVRHWELTGPEALHAMHRVFILQNFEGSMIRSLDGHYKCGRSTDKQGILLKLKNWKDEEAEVVGFEEQMHNTNEATTNELGKTKRSSAKAGKVGKDTLGALKCRFPDGAEFNVGTGMDDVEKQDVWDNQDKYLGQQVKVRHQPDPGGRQPGQAPRIPVFLGWRKD